MLKTVRQDVQIRNKLKTTARAFEQNGGHATKPCTKKYRKFISVLRFQRFHTCLFDHGCRVWPLSFGLIFLIITPLFFYLNS